MTVILVTCRVGFLGKIFWHLIASLLVPNLPTIIALGLAFFLMAFRIVFLKAEAQQV